MESLSSPDRHRDNELSALSFADVATLLTKHNALPFGQGKLNVALSLARVTK